MDGTYNANSPTRRTSSRNMAAGPSSPTKKNTTDIVTARVSRSTVKRNLTLPVHLTDSLKKMQITRDDTSVESLELNTPTGGPSGSSLYQKESNGMDVDDEPRATAAANTSVAGAPSSPRKRARKRARSLPPRPRLPAEDDDCDADDESGVGKGGVDDEEGSGGKASIVTITPRGRKREAAGDSSSEMAMDGLRQSGMMVEAPADVTRRSARRLRPIPMSAPRISMDHMPAHSNKKRARTRERNERGRNFDEFERSLKRIRKEEKV
jgi:hypothetical protein